MFQKGITGEGYDNVGGSLCSTIIYCLFCNTLSGDFFYSLNIQSLHIDMGMIYFLLIKLILYSVYSVLK